MWRKLSFFATLYFLQGAAFAYVVNFQKPYLAGRGISKETIGFFTGLLLIPFILKVFLGFLSDRKPIGKMGSRKPYMLLGLGLFGGCYFLLARLDPGNEFLFFATLTWIAALGLAWFDTCADGWAVDVAAENEESPLQAAMIAGKSIGLITMSGVFGLLGLRYGFAAIFKLLALLSLIVFFILLFVRSRPRRQVRGVIGGKEDLLKGFFVAFGIFGIVYSIASFGTDGLVTLYLSEARGQGPIDLGLFGMYRGGGALIGAVACVFAMRAIGQLRTHYFALALLGAGCLLPLATVPISTLGLTWGFAWGFQETAYVTLAMQLARGPWAASLFAVGMIFSNVGTSLGEVLAAPLVPQIGYAGVFGLFALIAWTSVVLVPKIFKF